MKNARARDRPARKIRKKFYSIDPQADGTVDVYLIPEGLVYPTDDGIREYDVTVLAVRGVVPWDGLESDIRKRYSAWCESADPMDI